MADDRFFHNSGPLSLQAVTALTGAVATSKASAPTDGSRLFTDTAPLDAATANDISFLDNVKYLEAFEKSKAGACFVRAKFAARAPAGMVLLVSETPYYCFAQTAQAFYPEPACQAGIAKTATVAASAKIGKQVRIDAGAVIGECATIGDGSWIGPNAVIGDGVEIGSGCRIGACSTISHALLGNRIILHPGVHIGQDGFGFAPGAGGIAKMPQLGRVLIGDDVEIGSGTCVDRGAGPDTVIGQSCKIDNLVQIGHNVRMGKFVMMAAQSGIAGSAVIDDGVLIGGQVGVGGHVHVGKGAKLAAQSGIRTNVPAGETYGGSPAMPAHDWHRQTVAMAKLAKKKKETEE